MNDWYTSRRHSFIKKERKEGYEKHNVACVRVQVSPFKFLKLTDFHQTWYEQYASKLHTNAIYSNFLQSVKTKWRRRELVTTTSATYICISKQLQLCSDITLK